MHIQNTIKNFFYTLFLLGNIVLLGRGAHLLLDAQRKKIEGLAYQVEGLEKKAEALQQLKTLQEELEKEMGSLKYQADIFEDRSKELFYQSYTDQGKTVYDNSTIYTGTYLYEISRKDLKKPSYLHGTIHVRNTSFRLPKEVKKAIQRSNLLITEVDYTDETFIQRCCALQDSLIAFYDQMHTTPIYTSHFFNYLKKYQDNPRRKFIWLVSPNYILNGEVQYQEELLYEAFAKDQKRMTGLETIEDIEELHYKGSNTDLEGVARSRRMGSLSSLLATLAQYENYPFFRRQTKKAYDSLTNQKPEGITLESNIKKNKMVYKRNIRWIPKINQRIKKGGAFIAVGARHLSDKKGLLNLLLQEGYTIRRIKADGTFVPVTQKEIDMVSVYDLQPIALPTKKKT